MNSDAEIQLRILERMEKTLEKSRSELVAIKWILLFAFVFAPIAFLIYLDNL